MTHFERTFALMSKNVPEGTTKQMLHDWCKQAYELGYKRGWDDGTRDFMNNHDWYE